MFIGDYKNGKKEGKAIEYRSNNEILFEGEYNDEKRNEKGKEYDKEGRIIFEGDIKLENIGMEKG